MKLKSKLKTAVRNSLKGILKETIDSSNFDLMSRSEYSRLSQINLMQQYRLLRHSGADLPSFGDVGFRVFSESDEDGILLFLFSILGTANRKLVDIGADIGGSNSANLIINHAFHGLLIEGDPDRAKRTNAHYSSLLETRNFPPKVINSWVTRDNINGLLEENEFRGEIDLLAIDIDGIDFYIWQAIEVISPRIVLVEYQCILGPTATLTVPYSENFAPIYIGQYGVYSGASLNAFVKLARAKGYRLVGCQRYGYNAFFVRNDIGVNLIPEVSPESCFSHPFTDWAQKVFLPEVESLDWVEV